MQYGGQEKDGYHIQPLEASPRTPQGFCLERSQVEVHVLRGHQRTPVQELRVVCLCQSPSNGCLMTYTQRKEINPLMNTSSPHLKCRKHSPKKKQARKQRPRARVSPSSQIRMCTTTT